MFRSIVIGYDAPDRGDESIALAEVLRDPRKGTLLLTSAYSLAPLAIGGFAVPREIEELREGTHKMLAAARDALPAKHRARILAVASESPARMLTEVAEAEHADLVVVGSSHRGAIGRVLPGTTAERLLFTGSRGYGPLRHALLGSVSGALVRDAGCPVVVMPRTAIAQDDPAPTVPRAVHA